MKNPLILGIDPGVSGGLAALGFGPNPVLDAMPKTERGVWDWISLYRAKWITDRWVQGIAVIERVGGFVRGNPLAGSAMFTFGMSYGGLRMALIAAGITFHAVTPQVWQRALGIPPRKKDEGKGKFKNRLKEHATKLFPKVHVTLKTCDTLLLAHYGRLTYG